MDVQRCLRKRNGSSPLTRGALRRRIGRAGWRRLIPAYAGSTQPVARQVVGVQAHPRLRGEHSQQQGSQSQGGGSSPLTRGAQEGEVQGLRHVRLIPAYAGSTMLRSSMAITWLAHPRLRGEHSASQNELMNCDGSSPLTRGARILQHPARRTSRLIPAYAGSTLADMHVSEPKVDFRSDLVERRTSSVDCDERYEQCSIRCAAETLTARLAAA